MIAKPIRVGAVLFPGFELLDICGPMELLGMLRERISITTLAQFSGEVACVQGPRMIAEQSLKEALPFDVFLIPGGMGTRREVDNAEFIQCLHHHATRAPLVGTICTGSALLARTGLLNGIRATSNKLAFKWVRTQGPETNWIPQARWVEDGKFFTSSGVSAGMDMTLALIQRLFDHETARQAAWEAEYLWNEDPTRDPFAQTGDVG